MSSASEEPDSNEMALRPTPRRAGDGDELSHLLPRQPLRRPWVLEIDMCDGLGTVCASGTGPAPGHRRET
jgi:hypothetical protein